VKYEIKNRWTGNVIYECEIDCDESASESVQRGLAVRSAVEARVNLSEAYIIDADLTGANLLGANFSSADLAEANLAGANLESANLTDAYLADADLTGANLIHANFAGAYLIHAKLTDANIACPIKIENIHQRVYAAASQPGALDMGSWYKNNDFYGTTHCRAGWVTHLAGDGGRALGWALGKSTAAALIYMASDPTLERVPDLRCDNETALADMKRLAEMEAERQKQ
jgi:hypothetical protein